MLFASSEFLDFPWSLIRLLKGKYHANLLLSIYHLSAIKLSISASGQRQSRPAWIETWKMLG